MRNLRHDIQEVISEGSAIAARAIVTDTMDGNFAGVSAKGRSFRVDQGLFARVEDGKIVEAWEIVDTASLLLNSERFPPDRDPAGAT
jgi:predicted ester cyclase